MDNLTPEQRKKNMRNIRSVNTKIELLVASALRKERIYFARNVHSLIGKPDFVFRKKRTVVFIDSDFWHGHPKRCVMPKSNRKYWNSKIKRNKQRDKEVSRQLRLKGWKVIRIWESDLRSNFHRSFGKITSGIGTVSKSAGLKR